MLSAHHAPVFGKKSAEGSASRQHGEAYESGVSRKARELWEHLALFRAEVAGEMKELTLALQCGEEADSGLLYRMTVVKDKYHYALLGLASLNDEDQRRVFQALADAIQELMGYWQMRQRRH